MTELKPCPFCGGNAKKSICEYEHDLYDPVSLGYVDTIISTTWVCVCEKCGALIADRKTEADVIEAWNTRYGQTRRCVQCGIEYEPTHPDQKHCSKDCKNAAYVDRSVRRGDGVPPWFAKQFGAKAVEQ